MLGRIIILGASLLSFGCNKKNKVIDPNGPAYGLPTSPKQSSVLVPDPYPGYESNYLIACSRNSKPLTEVGSYQSYKLYGGQVTVQGGIGKFGANPSVNSRYISQSSYAAEIGESCTDKGCKGNRLTRQGLNLSLCASSPKLEKNSVESIGLTAADHIESVGRFVESLNIKGFELSKLSLTLIPKHVQNGNQVEDNLTYFPNLENKPAIALYNRSQEGKALWPQFELWDSEWVLGHEYSHHIFLLLLQQRRSIGLIDAEVLSLIGEAPLPLLPKKKMPRKTKAPALSLAGESRTVSSALVINSFNEGFADLLSFYTQGADSRIFEGIKCLEGNRDPSVSQFGDGTPKLLTTEVLNRFLSASVEETVAKEGTLYCNTPDFQDIHPMGAIFAHGTYRLAEGLNTKEAANKLVSWIKNFPRYINNDPRAYYKEILEGSIQAYTKDGKTLSSQHCAIVKSQFAAFQTEWFQGSKPRFFCSN